MRRSIIRWIAVTLGILGISLLLTSLFSGNYNSYRTALGESLVWLGLTLLLRMRWPGSGQIDGALVVSMLLFILPRWLVDMVARWPIRWRLVAHVAWGTLLLLSLTSVVAAIFGVSLDAVILGAVVAGLNLSRMLFVMMTRVPADSRQQ